MLSAQSQRGCVASRRRSTAAAVRPSPLVARRAAPRPRVSAAASGDSATAVAELALGGTAVLAALTFGVAPRFRELFKEDVDWKQIHAELTAEGVEDISVEGAARLLASSPPGLVLIDARPQADFEAAHAPGAVNVPLYVPIRKWDAPSVIRRLAFAFFGIAGTEPNPDFDSDALVAIEGKSRVLVVCATGGSLAPKEGAAWGFSSRSLKALWRLRRAAGAGARLVHVCSGGMRDYLRGAGDDGRKGLEFATVGSEGDFEAGEEEEALEAMRRALGVKKAAAAARAAAPGRSASPLEGVLAAFRGVFSGSESGRR